MPNLASIPFEGTPEAVIAASLKYDHVALAVFPNETDFKSVIDKQPYEVQVESRLCRLAGRKILFYNGMVPVGIGAERVVLGIPKTGEVHKYARNSQDPDNDIEAELKDFDVCARNFLRKVIDTAFEVTPIQGEQALRERQPWLDLVPITTFIADKIPEINRQLEEIAEISSEFPLKYGAYLDGGAPMLDRATGKVVIPDTSLVYINKIFDFDTRFVDPAQPLHRQERTWPSIANPLRYSVQIAA